MADLTSALSVLHGTGRHPLFTDIYYICNMLFKCDLYTLAWNVVLIYPTRGIQTLLTNANDRP